MPVLAFDPERLKRLLGEPVSDDELREAIPMLGADLEDVEGEEWSVEFFPDRPDLFTVEGLARALRAFLEIDPGLPAYELDKPSTHVDVDEGLAEVRPYIGAAWVRGVELDDESIQALMAVQEDLHWGLGSRRSRVAIGVHDAEPLQPPFRYAAVGRDEISFTPLVGPEEQTSIGREMTPGEILEDHPKGREYASILEGLDRVPIILDASDAVLSFPPIINGTLTAVTPQTTELFIDTTGTDLHALGKVLNVLTTTLAETGADVEQVEIREPSGDHRVTPDLTPDSHELEVDRTNRLLGTDLDAGEVASALERLGHGARDRDGTVEVQVPAFRADVLHPVDLIEDVAIGTGYDTLEPALPREPSTGRELPWRGAQARVRQVLTGLGFLETMTLTLTSEELEEDRTGRDLPDGVTLENPVSEEQTRPRRTLLPSLLNLLSLNTHRDLPQDLFETGSVVTPEGASRRRVAFVRARAKTGFSDAKGLAQTVVEDGFDRSFEIEEADDPLFVDGRAASVVVDGDAVGIFGEVHPRTLDRFGLETPVVAFEMRMP